MHNCASYFIKGKSWHFGSFYLPPFFFLSLSYRHYINCNLFQGLTSFKRFFFFNVILSFIHLQEALYPLSAGSGAFHRITWHKAPGTHSLTTRHSSSKPVHLAVWFWQVWGNQRTRRKPTHIRGKHVSWAQDWARRPWSCESAMLALHHNAKLYLPVPFWNTFNIEYLTCLTLLHYISCCDFCIML